MQRPGWLIFLVLAAVVAHAGAAAADPNLVVVEPADFALDLGKVNIGDTSPPRRVRIQNTGTTAVDPTVDLRSGSLFQIVGSGGSLGPGEEAYWDIVAAPMLSDLDGLSSAPLVISYPVDDDYDIELDIGVYCQIRRTPLDASVIGFVVPPFTTTTKTLTVTNTSGAARTIASLSVADPAFMLALHTGALPLTVPPEAAFDIDVTFYGAAPSAVYLSEIDAMFDDGSSAYVAQVFGDTFGVMTLDSVSSVAWDGVPVGETWVSRGVLNNHGDTPQTITSIALDDPQFALVGIAVGTVIPPHGGVPVDGTFSPTAIGPWFSHITITFSGAADLTGGMGGEGVSPLVRITTDDGAPADGVLEFGNLELGSAPVTRGITITNISGHDISTNRCEAPAIDDFAPTECPSFIVLLAGASIHVDFVFTPSQIGHHVAVLTFSGNGMNYEIRVGVSAEVVSHGFALSQTTVAFADTARHPSAPAPSDVVLTNTGSVPLDVPAAQIDGDGFVLIASPPAGTIAPGHTVIYTVGFAPTAAAAFDAQLVLGPPASPLARIPLHGAGVLRPVTAAAELDVGSAKIGTTVRAQITLHNAGTAAVAIASATIASTTGAPRFRVIVPASPTIPAGGDLAIDIEYAPTALGSDAATLAIAFDTDPDPQLQIALRGDATADMPDMPGMPEPDAPAAGCGCHTDRGLGGSPLLVLAAAVLLRRRRSR